MLGFFIFKNARFTLASVGANLYSMAGVLCFTIFRANNKNIGYVCVFFNFLLYLDRD